MLKKILATAIIFSCLTSCASWFGSSQEVENNPAVGGRQDSSDMLFGQAESAPPMGPGDYATKAASAPANSASPTK